MMTMIAIQKLITCIEDGVFSEEGSISFFVENLMVGEVIVSIEEEYLSLTKIMSYQKGYGTKMIEYLKEYCCSNGITKIIGECDANQLGFYQKVGACIRERSGKLNESTQILSFFIQAADPKEVGSCDFCETSNVYIEVLKDKYGDEIMDRCYFGCGNHRNVPSEQKECYEILSIKKIDETPCYDTTWNVDITHNGENESIRLTRFNGETEEKLMAALQVCKNRDEMKRLNLTVVHN